MTDKELMQQALRYMESVGQMDMYPEEWAIVVALRERLAQPEQEPFGYFRYDLRLDAWVQNREGRLGTPFYAAPPQGIYYTPPQRTWVGLTDEEIKTLPQWFPSHESAAVMPLIRAFEAKLREKNT